jgi:FtsZ-binding cell division protein ZapB
MEMGPDTIIAVLTGAAGVAGGFFGGKRLGEIQVQEAAVNTVELLQVAVGELERQGRLKDEEVADLRARVDILESMITQRAEVEAVHEEVRGVKGVVDKIAAKVGA